MHSDLEENKNLTEICGQPNLNRATFITLGNSWGRKGGRIQLLLVDLKKNPSLLDIYVFLSVILIQQS